MIFPESCEVSVIVRKTKPGPPESESLTEQVPAAKSAAVPAHNSRFVPGVWFSNESFNIVVVVVVTGAPVTRYLPLVPTVPVMVVEARALPVETAKIPNPTIKIPSNARKLTASFLERSCWNIFFFLSHFLGTLPHEDESKASWNGKCSRSVKEL
jgi:hypothetical protein